MAKENENEKTEVDVIKSKYIHPLTDFGFKRLFLNKELLINFLNDVHFYRIAQVQKTGG